MKVSNIEVMLNHFNCKDCPGASVRPGEPRLLSTGIWEVEIVCQRCRDEYTVRWNSDNPDKYIICNRLLFFSKFGDKAKLHPCTPANLKLKKAACQVGQGKI